MTLRDRLFPAKLLAAVTLLLAASCQHPRPANGLPAPSLPLTPTPDAEFRQQPPPTSIGKVLHAPSVSVGALANGLKLIVDEDDEEPNVSVAFAGRAARDDMARPRNAPLAWLTRLTLLNAVDQGPLDPTGSHAVAAPVARWTTTSASSPGALLALTGPPGALESISANLAQILTTLELDEPSLRHAQARVADRPGNADGASSFALEMLYPSPAGAHDRDPTGTEAVSLAMVREFRKTHYVPTDSALIFAGPVTFDEASSLAGRFFADWTGKAPALDDTPRRDPRPGRRLSRLTPPRRGTDLSVVALPCAAPTSSDRLALEVLAHLLRDVMGSHFAQKLRHETGTSYTWRADCVDRGDVSTLLLELESADGEASQALEILLSELERLATKPMSDAELEASAMSYLAGHAALFTSSAGAARALGNGFLLGQPDDYYEKLEARVRALTPRDVQRVAQQYFQKGPMAVVACTENVDFRDHRQLAALATKR